MSDKLQLGIYKIKEKIFAEKQGKQPLEVSIDIQYLRRLFLKKGYKEQGTQSNLSNTFNSYLFFKRNKSQIRWKEFIANIAEKNAAILKHKQTNNESYILICENQTTNKIYATTGGYGHTAISDIIEGDFGLEILSRLIKAEDKTLRSTKEKNFTGGILGEVKFFRNDYNLNENENFGNFYQELHSALKPNILTQTFGFSKEDISSSCICIAKNSFMIKKSINFKRLIKIIEKCENLMNTVHPIVEINQVKKLTKADAALIKNLNSKLNKAIIAIYSENQVDISIELCHKDFDKYLHADNFILNFKVNGSSQEPEFNEPLKNLRQVITPIKDEDSNLSDEKLLKIIANTRITSKNSDGDIETDDLLRNHFYTEIQHDKKSYFLFDKEWFEIRGSFVEKLNEQCQDFINENTSNIQLDPWDYPEEDENNFNAKHMNYIEKNFLVFDKFTPENIEACDILHWDSDNIYFIHVKAGFNSSMRDLSHQIYIAARRVQEDSKTGYKFIEKLYDEVKNNQGKSEYTKKAMNQLNNLEKNEFLNLFRNRKRVFVLAVKDTAKSTRSLNNMKEFDSNIAKFSLHELVKNMRNLAVDFEIYEI